MKSDLGNVRGCDKVYGRRRGKKGRMEDGQIEIEIGILYLASLGKIFESDSELRDGDLESYVY